MIDRLPSALEEAAPSAVRTILARASEQLADPSAPPASVAATLELDPNLFNEKVAKSLSTYVGGLLRITRCKRAAFQLSADTWDEVCGTFLRLPPG